MSEQEKGRRRRRRRKRGTDRSSGKPLFFGIPDAAEVSRFFRPYRTFRSFDSDVGGAAAGGFRETRCGSALLAVAGQRLRKPVGCSFLGGENARRSKLRERSGNEDASIFNPRREKVLIHFFLSTRVIFFPRRVASILKIFETPETAEFWRWFLIARRDSPRRSLFSHFPPNKRH